MSIVSDTSLRTPMSSGLPPGPWTLDDAYRGAFPEGDGTAWELLDGMLLVSPAPRVTHQSVVLVLAILLREASPPGLLVLPGTNVDEEPATNLQPDIAVCRVADKDLPATHMRPLLVVEVASPSTRRIDRTVKREKYAELGVRAYWLVDTDVPELVALELTTNGTYAEVARVRGEQCYVARQPFPVRVVPADLLGDLRG